MRTYGSGYSSVKKRKIRVTAICEDCGYKRVLVEKYDKCKECYEIFQEGMIDYCITVKERRIEEGK